jgi:hypothetical protein
MVKCELSVGVPECGDMRGAASVSPCCDFPNVGSSDVLVSPFYLCPPCDLFELLVELLSVFRSRRIP